MLVKLPWQILHHTAVALLLLLAWSPSADAAEGPRTPEEFAQQYMAAFNKKDLAGLKKLRYPSSAKSDMQKMMDEMSEAELNAGTKYTKFEIKTVDGDDTKPSMGPDGVFYKPNLKPVNLVKMISVTENGTSSMSFPIGLKDGVYYQVAIEPAGGAPPAYKFGWQRFEAPQANWSVLMPNEPEPGRAALELEFGKDALKNPDIYGVVKNTADVKTFQHFYQSGEEGKRVHADDNKATYRVASTTYTPETLAKWFPDAKKNLDDAVDYRVRSNDGKLVTKKDIDLKGAPGREFEISEKDRTILGRVYWINNAMYELIVESRKDPADRAAAAKFLNSLEVK